MVEMKHQSDVHDFPRRMLLCYAMGSESGTFVQSLLLCDMSWCGILVGFGTGSRFFYFSINHWMKLFGKKFNAKGGKLFFPLCVNSSFLVFYMFSNVCVCFFLLRERLCFLLFAIEMWTSNSSLKLKYVKDLLVKWSNWMRSSSIWHSINLMEHKSISHDEEEKKTQYSITRGGQKCLSGKRKIPNERMIDSHGWGDIFIFPIGESRMLCHVAPVKK